VFIGLPRSIHASEEQSEFNRGVHPCPEKQVYRFWFVVIGIENNSSFKILNSKLLVSAFICRPR
jgi:hypothetical protein